MRDTRGDGAEGYQEPVDRTIADDLISWQDHQWGSKLA